MTPPTSLENPASTSNKRVVAFHDLPSPAQLLSDVPLGEGSSAPVGEPTPVDTSITETEFRGIERYRADEAGNDQAYEYWTIASKAMQREITVEVVPSRGTGDAPVLYMLDGVGAPISSTGWAHQAYIADRMKDENVHVVNPAGAYASYYTDWEEIDPVLGNNIASVLGELGCLPEAQAALERAIQHALEHAKVRLPGVE